MKLFKVLTVLDVLKQARALIDKPCKWCSYWSYSDDERHLGADGAVWEVAGFGTELAKQALHALAKHSGINPQWSDQHRVSYVGRHKEVMAMFDKAIESQEQPKE